MDRGDNHAEGDRDKAHSYGNHRAFDHCSDEEAKSCDDDRHTCDSREPQHDLYIDSFQGCDDATYISRCLVIDLRTPSFAGEASPVDLRAALVSAPVRP